MTDEPGEHEVHVMFREHGDWVIFGAHVEGEDRVGQLASVARVLWHGATKESRAVFVRALTVLGAEAMAREVGGVCAVQDNGETLHVADHRPQPPPANN